MLEQCCLVSALKLASARFPAFFDHPFVFSPRAAVAMRGKKTAAMTPEKRPDLFPVGHRQRQRIEFLAGNEGENTLAVFVREVIKLAFDFEEKHQPMALPKVTVLADDPGEMQFAMLKLKPKFFFGLAAGAFVWRFAGISVKLAATRTPETAIGLEVAMQQQDLVFIAKTVKQRRNFIRQTHGKKPGQQLGHWPGIVI
jgi:hypothetical protein